MPQSQRGCWGSCNVNSMHLLFVLLYWQGVNSETNFSQVTTDLVTSCRTIEFKGQSHVIVEELEILKPQNVELLCNLTDIPSKPSNITGFWRKNGSEIENSQQTIHRHNEQYILKKIFNITASDLGNYSCVFSYLGKEEQVTFVLKETNFSQVTTDLVTARRTIVHKGQSHVIVEELEILKPQKVELLCNLTDIPSKPSNITGFWRKNGSEIENSQQTIHRHNEQYVLKEIFNITASDLGNYSCVFSYLGKEEQATFVLKVPAVIVKQDRPIVSYIGDTVVLKCEMKPTPNTWEWYKINGTEKMLINATADPTHYKILLENDVTKLILLNLTEEDSGKYKCSAIFDIKPSESQFDLKVLSFTEPLKPFVAIAVEVVILVTLILLYERCSHKQKGPSGTTENGLYEHAPTQEENATEDGGTTTRQRKVEH